MGVIKLGHDRDAVLMVLMDERYETVAIFEADRQAVEGALRATPSKARERGSLSVSTFRSIARSIWPEG